MQDNPMKDGNYFSRVYVEWLDSMYDKGIWIPEEDIMKFAREEITKCYTLGFLIHEHVDFISVCQSYNQENQYASVIKIPMKSIIRIEYLVSK